MLRPSTLAMILAGSRVNELGVLTHYRPKSAVPFGGFARVIDFPLSNLLHSGIELIAILSQYRSYSLINHIGTGAAWDMIGRHRGISILPPFKDYDSPHWYRGSADAVYQNLDFIQYHNPSDLLILSGDHVYQMDYQKMINYHNENDADLTAAFVKVPQDSASRFGVGEISEDSSRGGKLLSYEEKPNNPKSCWASLTVFCFKPQSLYKVLKENQKSESYEFGRDVIPLMMAKEYNVHGYFFDGYWGYTRTIDEYYETSMDLLGENPKIDIEAMGVRTNLGHRNIVGRQPLVIGSQGQMDNSMAYNGCVVEGIVRNSILFPGVKVEKGAEVHDSVLFFDNTVKSGSRISKVVSDVNTTFGNESIVGNLDAAKVSVVGWNNNIPNSMRIGSGCTIAPRVSSDKWPKEAVLDGEVLK